MVEMGADFGLKPPSFLNRSAPLRAAPDTNLHGEGKMPSGQPAGRATIRIATSMIPLLTVSA